MTKDKQIFKMDDVHNFEGEVLKYISQDLRNILKKVSLKDVLSLQEIRMRANRPLMISNGDGSFFIDFDGSLTKRGLNLVYVSSEQILKTLELISENSIYAFQEEIKNGFVTLKGGHRVGITGKVVLEGGNIRNIKDISGLNIRIAREVYGCSNGVLKYIVNGSEIYNTLIISPPQCGKTTILRDIARNLSDGIVEMGFEGVKVGIVDERSEIASCYRGVAQNRVGVRTDILDGCPKNLGMVMMLRSMSPNVIITDEIGNKGDGDSLRQVQNAGIKVITTAHGYNISQLKSRIEVLNMMEEKIFERYIVLSSRKGPGTIEEVIDGRTMKNICREDLL